MQGRLVTFFITLVLGMCAGFTFGGALSNAVAVKDTELHQAVDSNSLISPLLGCVDMPPSVAQAAADPLKKKIAEFIKAETQKGHILNAAVYWRDLSNGPSFGVNPLVTFSPASMLKLPLAMSFYTREDSSPGTLAHLITYTPDPSVTDADQPYPPKTRLEPGKQYTIRELIRFTLEGSSNEAAEALAAETTAEQISATYSDLGLTPPTFGQDYAVTAQIYASFFRVLYNASYLSRPASEEVLATLTTSNFIEGIVAGVPPSVRVAHKFGSRQLDSLGAEVQLHDCGIVYPPRPAGAYLLCVMTQGSDFATLAGTIKQISKVTYDYVVALH